MRLGTLGFLRAASENGLGINMLMRRTSRRRGFGAILSDPLGLDITGGATGPIGDDSSANGNSEVGDYCIELSSGSSFCFSLVMVALVVGGGIFALAMLSGGRHR
jgi:hypothetical protein